MKKFKSIFIYTAMLAGVALFSCEGPMGPAGEDGLDGDPGVDANETCKLCHNSTQVDAYAIQYEHSLHYSGEAFEEGTRNNCAPCHSHQGFTYVTKNSTLSTFVLNTATSKYENQYVLPSTHLALPGPISCFTCHSSLHTDYEATEFLPLATTAAVSMTMYGGTKTINFAKANANLCAKCHQPRPVTKSSDSNVMDYADLVTNKTQNMAGVSIGYRTGIHYGAQGAMAAGVGGIEFTGSAYTQSAHVAGASCQSCHMATPSGLSGGHSFYAAGNYNGCNTTGCHTTMSGTNATLTAAKSDIATKLEDLADKINLVGAGNDILFKESDGTYHGYLNIFDYSSNPTGYYKAPSTSGWPADAITTNSTKPVLPTLTKAQFGAIINYQMVYRDGSKGVHNYPYMKALLDNTIAAW